MIIGSFVVVATGPALAQDVNLQERARALAMAFNQELKAGGADAVAAAQGTLVRVTVTVRAAVDPAQVKAEGYKRAQNTFCPDNKRSDWRGLTLSFVYVKPDGHEIADFTLGDAGCTAYKLSKAMEGFR